MCLSIFTVKIQPRESEKVQSVFSCTRVAKEYLVQPCWFTVKIQPWESGKVQPIFSCTGVAKEHLLQPCWFGLKPELFRFLQTTQETLFPY